MPRSNRPRRPQPRRGRSGPADGGGGGWIGRAGLGVEALQEGPDGAWHVRRIPGPRAVKDYTCPGCGGPIRQGTEHVVAWRADHWMGDEAAAAERRHWHGPCWSRRRPPRL